MAYNDKSKDNLVPPVKGEVRNPNGRGKSKNRATVLMELLSIKKKGVNILKSDETVIPAKMRIENMTVEKHLELALIKRGLEGDVQALKLISEKVYGRIPLDLNLGGQEDNPIVIDKKVEQLSYYERLVIVYGKDSDEVKEYLNDNPGADKRASED